MPPLENLIGQKFGRLLVIESAPPMIYSNGRKRIAWRCLCDCGNTCTVVAFSLKNGGTQSCGCAKVEMIKRVYTKHDGTHDRLYNVWSSMKKRCYNPKDKEFHNYGGRGIIVCDEWLNDYSSFKRFAMLNGYDPNAKRGKSTLDRIDVDGNYCPENCRFVDMKIQNNNKRRSKQ